VQQPDVKPVEVPTEPIATQTSIPIQIAFSDQTSDQIIPGQSLNMETIVTALQSEKVTLSTQLLDKDILVKIITLMAKGNGIYQGGLSAQETADLIPRRSYQLKSVAEDGNSKAEAIEDLTIAQVITEPDEPFDLQIPTFFNMEGIPLIQSVWSINYCLLVSRIRGLPCIKVSRENFLHLWSQDIQLP
jgi:hypothetical protein